MVLESDETRIQAHVSTAALDPQELIPGADATRFICVKKTTGDDLLEIIFRLSELFVGKGQFRRWEIQPKLANPQLQIMGK